MTFLEAQKIIKNRQSKKIKNNTYLIKINDDSIGVKLHNTIVVTIHKNGSYTLNTNGWRTVTTKQRINQYCPIGVYQRKNRWYVGTESHPFFDGMIVKKIGDLEVVLK